eukprot:gene33241-38590_t
MGVNVIWHYIRKYGDDLIEKHIFVDQPVAITGGKDAFANGYKKEWIIHSLFTAKPKWMSDETASFVSPDIAQFIKDRVSGPARVITYPAPYGTHAPFFGHYYKDQELGKYGERKFCEDAFAFLEEKVDC